MYFGLFSAGLSRTKVYIDSYKNSQAIFDIVSLRDRGSTNLLEVTDSIVAVAKQ